MKDSYDISFDIGSGDFSNAGKASRNIKNTLQQLGINQSIIRKIAVATYEAEMNIIIHSFGGKIRLIIEPELVIIIAQDEGPGIENVQLAMTEGFSTAPQEVREMGFGAGMGLPNMKLNADNFMIQSKKGKGTEIRMTFSI